MALKPRPSRGIAMALTAPMFGSFAVAFFLAAPAMGQEKAATGSNPAADAPPSQANSVAVDVGLASMYIFRGLNVFAKDDMMDQHAFVAPSVTWTGMDGALTLGYWGAYQLLGGNVGERIDAGAGGENDLTVAYTRKLDDQWSVVPGGIVYLYPFADKKVAGTGVPTVVEPMLGVAFSGPVDASVKISYFYAAQDAIEGWRHVYINPSVAKSLMLSEQVGLSFSGSFGYKAAADFDSNVYDGLLTVAAPISLGTVVMKPGLSAAWTNFKGLPLGDEWAAYASVNVGTTL